MRGLFATLAPPARLVGLLVVVAFSLASHVAVADVFRPAYLELREAGGERYDVTWKVPAQSQNVALALNVVFPAGTRIVEAPRTVFTEGALLERWSIEHPGGLVGQAVRITGKAVRATDVIARVERLDGTSQVERLALERPEFTVEAPSGTAQIAWSYLVLGIEHILGGIDHLLFVLGLLLVVRTTRRLVTTITAFTLAHSLTLVAAGLGWVHVPGPPVEAVIALSIVFVAAEAIRTAMGRPGLAARAPWLVAFTFGLLHGFGFAGALSEVGLPEVAIPVALLTFNVGVELGQLLFVGACLALTLAARRLSTSLPRIAQSVAPYFIGGLASFWFIERVTAFWE